MPPERNTRGGKGAKGLFQRLLLWNRLPQKLAAEKQPSSYAHQEAKGQKVSEGSAGPGSLHCSCGREGQGTLDAGAGRFFAHLSDERNGSM